MEVFAGTARVNTTTSNNFRISFHVLNFYRSLRRCLHTLVYYHSYFNCTGAQKSSAMPKLVQNSNSTANQEATSLIRHPNTPTTILSFCLDNSDVNNIIEQIMLQSVHEALCCQMLLRLGATVELFCQTNPRCAC